MVIREVENLKPINRNKSCANLQSQTEGMDFFGYTNMAEASTSGLLSIKPDQHRSEDLR